MLDDEVMRRDVFPAEVLMPDGSLLAGVRAFVTSHRLAVFGLVEGTPEQIVNLELDTPYSVPASRNSLLVMGGQLECRVDGGTAWVNAGRGCGCGSRLKVIPLPVPWTRRNAA